MMSDIWNTLNSCTQVSREKKYVTLLKLSTVCRQNNECKLMNKPFDVI